MPKSSYQLFKLDHKYNSLKLVSCDSTVWAKAFEFAPTKADLDNKSIPQVNIERIGYSLAFGPRSSDRLFIRQVRERTNWTYTVLKWNEFEQDVSVRDGLTNIQAAESLCKTIKLAGDKVVEFFFNVYMVPVEKEQRELKRQEDKGIEVQSSVTRFHPGSTDGYMFRDVQWQLLSSHAFYSTKPALYSDDSEVILNQGDALTNILQSRRKSGFYIGMDNSITIER